FQAGKVSKGLPVREGNTIFTEPTECVFVNLSIHIATITFVCALYIFCENRGDLCLLCGSNFRPQSCRCVYYFPICVDEFIHFELTHCDFHSFLNAFRAAAPILSG